jgi:hypothetical protein
LILYILMIPNDIITTAITALCIAILFICTPKT